MNGRRAAVLAAWAGLPVRRRLAVLTVVVLVGLGSVLAVPVAFGSPGLFGLFGSTGPLRLVAAGDMACDPADPMFTARSAAEGDHCRHDDASEIAVRLHPDLLLGLGDYQYEVPTAKAYRDVYGPSWGRLRQVTVPVFGNQEYKVRDAQPFRAYFGDRIGAQRGYWSVDIGAWHLVVLNSNCATVAGGCGEDSPQQRWLRRDLDGTDRRCVLAAWHHPRWSTGIAGPDDRTTALYRTLYAHRVELLLSGHEADYERFDQLDPAGRPDPAGVRQLVVGTGGQSHYAPTAADTPWRGKVDAPASAYLDHDHHGVLELNLAAGRWQWRFHALGAAVADHGGGRCF
jgi:hypothetical protein